MLTIATAIFLTLFSTWAEEGKMLTLEQKNQLKQNFERALGSETLSLRHRQEIQLKELDASLTARRQRVKDQAIRDKDRFFKEHQAVDARRRYLDDEKRTQLSTDQRFLNERVTKLQEHQQALQELEKNHTTRRQQFQDFLSKGQQPPADLWSAGH